MMDTILILVFFLLGTILGSFANVCIWRLPRGESVVAPPSRCPACGIRLRPWHLVPVLSWVLLRGRCAACHNSISWRYPFVELAMGLLFALIAWQWQLSVQSLLYALLTFSLVVAVGTDMSHREVPDEISWGTSAVLAVLVLATQRWDGLVGGIVLFSVLLLIAVASRGGMGGGDIKLSLAIGLALGWQLGLVALVVAFASGGILATVLMLRGARGKALPFVPFLAVGSWIAMFWGRWLIELYLNFSFFLWGW